MARGKTPPRKPTDEQFEIAVLWLESNEGEGDELQACRAVAQWIEDQAFEAKLRSEARKAGVTVANLRRKLSNGGDPA